MQLVMKWEEGCEVENTKKSRDSKFEKCNATTQWIILWMHAPSSWIYPCNRACLNNNDHDDLTIIWWRRTLRMMMMIATKRCCLMLRCFASSFSLLLPVRKIMRWWSWRSFSFWSWWWRPRWTRGYITIKIVISNKAGTSYHRVQIIIQEAKKHRSSQERMYSLGFLTALPEDKDWRKTNSAKKVAKPSHSHTGSLSNSWIGDWLNKFRCWVIFRYITLHEKWQYNVCVSWINQISAMQKGFLWDSQFCVIRHFSDILNFLSKIVNSLPFYC